MKAKCSVCGWIGHGYQQGVHYSKAHKAVIHVKVVELLEGCKALLEFENGCRVIAPFRQPDGMLVEIEVHGVWKK